MRVQPEIWFGINAKGANRFFSHFYNPDLGALIVGFSRLGQLRSLVLHLDNIVTVEIPGWEDKLKRVPLRRLNWNSLSLLRLFNQSSQAAAYMVAFDYLNL